VNAQVDARLRTVVVGLNQGAIKERGDGGGMLQEMFSRDTVSGALANYDLLADVGPFIAQRRFWIESGGFR